MTTTLTISDIELEVDYTYLEQTFDTREQPGEPASIEIHKIECKDILGLMTFVTLEEIEIKLLEHEQNPN